MAADRRAPEPQAVAKSASSIPGASVVRCTAPIGAHDGEAASGRLGDAAKDCESVTGADGADRHGVHTDRRGKKKYELFMSEKALKLLGVFEDEKHVQGTCTLEKAAKVLGMRPNSSRVVLNSRIKRLQNLRKRNIISYEEFVALRTETMHGDTRSLVGSILSRLVEIDRALKKAGGANSGHGAGIISRSSRDDKGCGGRANSPTLAKGVGSQHNFEPLKEHNRRPRNSSLTGAELNMLGLPVGETRIESDDSANAGHDSSDKTSELRASALTNDGMGHAIKRPKSPYSVRVSN